jgi:hypothetical protein
MQVSLVNEAPDLLQATRQLGELGASSTMLTKGNFKVFAKF